jgi:hypothetical protein
LTGDAEERGGVWAVEPSSERRRFAADAPTRETPM